MDFDEFLKELEKANKRELEKAVWNKANNNLKVRLVSWIKAFRNIEKIAKVLGFQITFSKIKKSKR